MLCEFCKTHSSWQRSHYNAPYSRNIPTSWHHCNVPRPLYVMWVLAFVPTMGFKEESFQRIQQIFRAGHTGLPIMILCSILLTLSSNKCHGIAFMQADGKICALDDFSILLLNLCFPKLDNFIFELIEFETETKRFSVQKTRNTIKFQDFQYYFGFLNKWTISIPESIFVYVS